MAYDVIWTPDAKRDLDFVVSYYAEVLGMTAAAGRLIDRMGDLADTLAASPEAHELSRDSLLAARGYRKAVVGSHIVLYLVDNARREVVVTDIFSGSQNYARRI